MEKQKSFVYTENLTVGYDGKPLIRDIRLSLEKGQILTLIGPNGAGKSTILKSLIRQLKLVGGAVWLDNTSMERMTDKEISRKMAVVMTERIHPELMTCEDVVATGRYPYTGTLGILGAEDHEKVKSAMQLVHAWELRDRDFSAISDGQRQRILLARAICQEPEVIVLDEPTSFLDIRHKLELLAILKQMVHEKHVAVLMSLHELDLAQKVSDLVICVHGDRIERMGVPEEIWPIAAVKCLEAMPFPLPARYEDILRRASSCEGVLIGPGLGRAPRTERLVRSLLEDLKVPVVLDADGINALDGHIDSLDGRRAPTILTPHAGEFARLTGRPLPLEDPLTAARDFARDHRCVLVLKGHRTVTAAPDGRAWINTTGNPGMSKGGSGDVLAGLILALLGQGWEPELAARDGVYLHGEAGDRCAGSLGEYGMTPGDLVERLPETLEAHVRSGS